MRGRPKRHSEKPPAGRASIGIRALKTNASAIVKDVRTRRVTYAVTRRGSVEALIVPGERLLTAPPHDSAWDAWEALATKLASEAPSKLRSAATELARMRR